MKVAFETGPWRMCRILFLDWKEMRINIPQKAFSFQCTSLYVYFWKCQKLIRKAFDEGIGMNGSHANPRSDSLEICSPSASWCQQKCQEVSGEKASVSSSFYRHVMPTREVWLMRGGPCSRANSFYGSTKWKNQWTKKSGYCAFWFQFRCRGGSLANFIYSVPINFCTHKIGSPEYLCSKEKFKVTRIKENKC